MGDWLKARFRITLETDEDELIMEFEALTEE